MESSLLAPREYNVQEQDSFALLITVPKSLSEAIGAI